MIRRFTTATVLAAALLLAAATCRAADDLAAQSDFFREGASARSFGLGSAFAGISDDVSAVYWNPAGLGQLRGPQVQITKTQLGFFDSDIQSFAAAMPYGPGVFGLNYVTSNTDVPLFGQNPGNPLRFDYPLGVTSERYQGTSLSYAMQSPQRQDLYLGATIKSMKYSLFNNNTSGTGIDIGALLKMKNDTSIGLNLQNLGGVKLGVMDEVPFNIQLGASRKFTINKASKTKNSLTPTAAYDNNYLGASMLSLGAEYLIAEHFTARLGSHDGKLAYGFSVSMENFSLDYALNSGADESEMNKLSIAYNFPASPPKPPKKKEPPKAEKKPETKPAEKKPAEKKPAEKKPAEKKPVEKKPAEKKPAEKKSTEKKPAEKKPAEKKPVEKKEETTEKKPAEETADKPAEKKPEEKKPAVKPPVEEDDNAPIKLPSIQDLLGETPAPEDGPSPYVQPSYNSQNKQRFPTTPGEFGLSDEYDGNIF